ncbi:MAG TPA: hypothetical protein VJA46_03610 [Acidimicrobiia bacterium]|nr:hypothetical protein [Acidimicrobiia bacterium]
MGVSKPRHVGWLGFGFAILLFLSSAMVSAPRSDAPLGEIGAFYAANQTIILIAQALGLVAAVILVLFIFGLSELLSDTRVKITGMLVAAAAALTSVPLIVMTFQGSDLSPTMVSLTDITDAVLFLAIAVLFAVLATNSRIPMWIRGPCVVGAGLTLVRGYLGFGPVFTTLDVIAPLSFVVIVLVLAGWAFRASPGSHRVV